MQYILSLSATLRPIGNCSCFAFMDEGTEKIQEFIFGALLPPSLGLPDGNKSLALLVFAYWAGDRCTFCAANVPVWLPSCYRQLLLHCSTTAILGGIHAVTSRGRIESKSENLELFYL